MSIIRAASALVLLSGIALLSACGSSTSVGLVVPAGMSATGSVVGRIPVVELRNDGPGSVDAKLQMADGEGFNGRLAPGASTAHKLLGPLRIRFDNRGTTQASVFVDAQGADGVTLTLTEKK
jgi:hypothetical protein